MKNEKFNITGMTCASCQANITKRIQKLNGVKGVNVSLLANQMSVTYDESLVNSNKIVAAVTGIGYGASSLLESNRNSNGFRGEWQMRQQVADDARKTMKRRLRTSVILLIPLIYLTMGPMVSLPVPGFLAGSENALILALTELLLTVPIVIVNRNFYISGFKAFVKRVPNMDSLVATGSSVALIYGIFAMYRMAYGFGHGNSALALQYSHELYFDSCAMILTLVTVGKYLEVRSKSKTSDALGKLVDLAPKTATVMRNGNEQTIPAEQVAAGDIVVIKPGESVPVDGIVTDGNGSVDQSAVTGESIPVEKNAGDPVVSATINKNGVFRFRASKVGNDTTLAQIIRLVDEAGNSKAPIARLADRISGIFVPAVMGIALVTAVVWLLAGKPFEFALSCAIAVLVISCPCALGLATPVAIMVGTGKAAEYGILIKSAESLENLHSVDTVVLDKTGTITSGRPSVTDVKVLDPSMTELEFLGEAASAESGSEHPLALAILEKAKSERAAVTRPSDFKITAGRGVAATVNSSLRLAGNLAFMEENGLLPGDGLSNEARAQAESLAAEGKTSILFAKDGQLTGVIAVADTIRETSRAAVRRFHDMGLRTVMLTGDNRAAAETVRVQAGVDEAVADVLPAEKEAHVRSLQAKGHKVVMVGDGINDAPALTRADIGVAIGAGTDIAIESADVVLMKDSLNDAATAIDLSRSVIRNIRINLFWAFFYNILGIPLAAGALYPAFGLRLSPMIGAAAMSLSSLCVVTNALRLRHFKEKSTAPQGSDMTVSAVSADRDRDQNDGEQPLHKEEKKMKKIITVDGMMCDHCRMHVQNALAAVDGVKNVSVDLKSKKATVILSKDVDDKTLFDAVTGAGYKPIGCSAAKE